MRVFLCLCILCEGYLCSFIIYLCDYMKNLEGMLHIGGKCRYYWALGAVMRKG